MPMQKIRLFIIPIVIAVLFAAGFAQKADLKAENERQKIKLARRAAVDNLDVEIQRIPVLEVRNHFRYLTADWLWEDKKDEEYAEAITVNALEELIEKDDKGVGRCESEVCVNLLTLLDVYAPAIKKKIYEKHRFRKGADLSVALSDLIKNGSAKKAVDALIEELQEPNDAYVNGLIIDELVSANSPDLPRLLEAVLMADERGSLSLEQFGEYLPAFISRAVPEELKMRFYQSVAKKGIAALSADDEELPQGTLMLVSAAVKNIPESFTALRSQLEFLETAVSTKLNNANTQDADIYDRIAKATDKLAATITEAENAPGKNLKENLYTSAVKMAIGRKKLQLALDLIDKLVESRLSRDKDGSFNKKFEIYYDQFYGEIAFSALKENTVEINTAATVRISNTLTRAASLVKTAHWLFDNKRPDSASEKLKEAFRLTGEAENSARRVNGLLLLILDFQEIDRTYLVNITQTTAKALDRWPILEEKDARGTDSYDDYVTGLTYASDNLIFVFGDLQKKNKLEATYMANRINRPEFKRRSTTS